MSNSNTRNRSDSQVPGHMAESNPSSANLGREGSLANPRAPRVPMGAGDFNLAVPEGTIPSGKVGYWFSENDSGRIAQALAAYWEPVADKNGVNITRASGSSRVHLMAIEKIYYDEDEALRMDAYRASMGARDAQPLEGGVESYVPNGAENKIRVNSDPFA